MVLSYLRWESDVEASFGQIASSTCSGVVFLKNAGLAVAGAGEAVAVWQLKGGALVHKLVPEGRQYSGVGARARPQVTHLRAHPAQPEVVAAGYSDGSVRLWHIRSGKDLVTLAGHRGPVTALAFSGDGARLYTGGNDTDVIAWDVVAETGLFRLRGHKAPVTDLLVLESQGGPAGMEHNHLVSSSKDTLVKVWDMTTQACVQTLVGHRAEVTALAATGDESVLVTGAAEGPLRVWRIHPTGRPDEPAAPATRKEKTITVKLEPGVAAPPAPAPAASTAASSSPSSSSDATVSLLTFWGFLPRESKRRVASISFWPLRSAEPTMLLTHAAGDRMMEMFAVRGKEEIEKKVKRRKQRQREKAKKHAGAAEKKGAVAAAAAGADVDMTAAAADAEDTTLIPVPGGVTGSIPLDQFQSLLPLRTSVKISAFCPSESRAHLRVLMSMGDNSMQVWGVDAAGARSSMDAQEDASETAGSAAASAAAAAVSHYTQLYSLTALGHRSGIRVVALNADSSTLMTASGEQVKIWNLVSKACIRTIESGFALCGMFVPGSRHVIIGTKAGELELYDLASGNCIQKVLAHAAEGSAAPTPVYCMDLRPDQKGFATGGGDKEAKLWDFELLLTKQDEDSPAVRTLQIVHTKTLKLTDDVLALRHSPDGRLLALGLLDCTIKLFYADSLKFFLSLYGHKLPVLAIDISSDSNLLVSGSADKNVKLWGLDFGDCHKSLFGHADSITAVRFIRGTHMFFSAGKDRLVKLWDGDTFEQVQVLEAHTAEVWSLALNVHGNTLVTAGNDKCVRVFTQSDQQLFLEEERETRLEQIYDEGATVEARGMGAMEGSGMVAPPESALVARTQAREESLKAGERLIEALDLADADRERWLRYDEALREQRETALGMRNGEKLTGLELIAAQQKKAEVLPTLQPNPLIRGPNADSHVLHALQSIPTPELDEALLVLPFDYACRLIPYLNRHVARGVAVELCVHALLFLLHAHHKQLIAAQLMLPTLRESRDHVRRELGELKRTLGFNMAAMAFLGRQAQEQQVMYKFGDAEAPAAEKPQAAPIVAGVVTGAAAALQQEQGKKRRRT